MMEKHDELLFVSLERLRKPFLSFEWLVGTTGYGWLHTLSV